MFTRYGKSWSPYRNRCLETRGGLTIWEFLAAPTILCVGVAIEHCLMQGMVPGTVVLTCEPCLAFLRTPSGSFRAGVPGRMVPSRFWRASRRVAMGRVVYGPRSKTRGQSRRRSSGQAFRVEAVRRQLGLDISAPIGEAIRSWPEPELVLRSERRAEGGQGLKRVLRSIEFRLLGRSRRRKGHPSRPSLGVEAGP